MASQTALAHAAQVSPATRYFYIFMSLACALTAFVGFGRTYFFRGLSELPPLSIRAHLHGAVFSAWMLLFFTQAALVRARQRNLHRRLGIVGAVLAALMVWTGVAAALGVAARFQATGVFPHGLTPIAFLATQLGMVAQFAVLVALAIAFRRRSEVHKRLMVLATISILPPAVARLHLENYGLTIPFASTFVAYLLIVVAVSCDLATTRRVHPAYLWGGVAIFAWMFLRYAIGRTEAWQAMGQWLIS